MKVHLTEVLVIVGKDKREWLKLSGVSDKGEVITGLLPKPLELPEVDVSFEELANFQSHDVSFDQRGRIVDVSA